jgi:hypothetical protein
LSTEITNHNDCSFLFLYRTNAGNNESSADIPNRQVSLANIATAFLTERKSSSHRQSTIRRKKRLTNKGAQTPNPTAADEILGPRLSADNMEVGIGTLFVPHVTTNNGDNKHRSSTVRKKKEQLVLLLTVNKQ